MRGIVLAVLITCLAVGTLAPQMKSLSVAACEAHGVFGCWTALC
jgi:hypothetical protein